MKVSRLPTLYNPIVAPISFLERLGIEMPASLDLLKQGFLFKGGDDLLEVTAICRSNGTVHIRHVHPSASDDEHSESEPELA